MKNYSRLLIAIVILLFGSALIPFVKLPTETFSWQRYINTYQDPFLTINYFAGQPGSFFTVSGGKFSPNETAQVTANGQPIGTIPTDSAGNLLFLLSSSNAEVGYYEILVTVNQGAAVTLSLQNNAPLRAQEDVGTILSLPADIAEGRSFLPLVPRNVTNP